jgi:Family of unknown function (DUF6518)
MDARPDLDRSRAPAALTVAPALVSSMLLLVVASFALGGLTSWAQGVLPDAWAPLANSPSGWTVTTALVVAPTRPGLVRGAVFGGVGFVCLVLGYTFAAELRGLSYSPVFWSLVGVLAGPFVGAAAAALLSRRHYLIAIGSGILAGVLAADGIYGLTKVADTTSPVYWTTALVTSLLILVVTSGVRLRSLWPISLQICTWIATTGAITLGYAALNSLG